jgi:Ca-activated chloride channel family protein
MISTINRLGRWSLIVALIGVLAACTGGPPKPSPPPVNLSGPAYTLRVLGSSELDDMTPVLERARQATGVKVDLTPIGSLAGAQLVHGGQADGTYDAVWFASDHYLNLYSDTQAKLNGTVETMSSPVILGVRTSVAQRLGWTSGHVSWADIAAAAGRGEFTFAMTDPGKSNSGLSTLVAVATAVAGHGAALTSAGVDEAVPQLVGLFHAQSLKADSSGWLTDQYRADLTSPSGTKADAIFDYESELLALNASLPSAQALTLIYPSDGVLRGTYPISLLTSAPSPAADAFHRLTTYLRTAAAQDDIMKTTHRRPIAADVALIPPLSAHQPVELPFPNSLDTVRHLIDAYGGTLRRPGRTVYVLDTSGSMDGTPIGQVKTALKALTGADPSLFAQFSQLEANEQVTFLPFDGTVGAPTTFTIPASSPDAVLAQIRSYIDNLHAGGATAIYDALAASFGVLASEHASDPNRIESIVLLTDGDNNTGRSSADFSTFYNHLPAPRPPVFSILFGKADRTELDKISTLTGGKTFDGVTQPLTDIFEQIRAYQ